MTAGDITVGYATSIEKLEASLVAESVTLAGKSGELTWEFTAGKQIAWVHIVQA